MSARTSPEIDAKIDEWHRSDLTIPLHEFLGMNWEEYAAWVDADDEAWLAAPPTAEEEEAFAAADSEEGEPW